jgi:hypothetical protein
MDSCTDCLSPRRSTFSIYCTSCGAKLPPIKQRYKKPRAVVMLSLLLPGLGQVYLGEIGKGLIFIAISLVAGVFQLNLKMLSANWQSRLAIGMFLFFGQVFLCIWLAWDGYETSKRMNEVTR